jgi:hypothetical protein
MNRPHLLRGVAVVVALGIALGVRPAPAEEALVGPLDLSGQIDGAPYRIVVPTGWNGALLVYAHDYRDKADHPGEVDDRSAPLAPSPDVASAALARGYALAGTAYRDNGWAVAEGLEDVRALAAYFRDTVAHPTRTILWGMSLGSVIVLETAEHTGGLFDGFLAGCAVGAGAPRGVADGTLVLRLAYDVAFGMPASWGTPGDLRDDLDFETEVRPLLIAQMLDPTSAGRWEFVRLVTGIPGSGIIAPDGFFPGQLIGSFFYATEATAELERRAGGPVGQNLTHAYRLSATETAYLAGLGLDPGPLLAAMNTRRTIAAPPGPRNYVERFADYTGAIKAPVLTMHTVIDPITPISHESAYLATVATWGRAGLLAQAYTDQPGHCGFTPEQGGAALAAIDRWVRTGTAPGPNAFPTSLGFLTGFGPPPWPQP